MPLISDHFLVSLIVMFRISSLISLNFGACGTFSLPPNKLLGQAVALASFLLEIVSSAFLIQRPCSSSFTTRLLLTTSSFLRSFTSFTCSFLSIPLEGCIKFIRSVTRVIINCSEWDTASTSRGWGLQAGPSEWTICALAGSRLSCSVFDSGFVILQNNKFRLLKWEKSVLPREVSDYVIQK